MKICFLAFDFLPNPGGVAAHVYELSKALVRRGHEVDVITYNRVSERIYYSYNISGINVYSFGVQLFQRKFRKINNLLLLPVLLAFLLRRVSKYDILHFHGFFSIDYYILYWLKKILKLKVVWTNHTSGYLEEYKRKNYSRLNKLLAIPDWIIAPSSELAEKSWRGVKFEKSCVTYIANGVDTQKFTPCDKDLKLLASVGLDLNHKIALCTRRLEKKNGVRFLVEAVPEIIHAVPNFKLIIIGDYEGKNDNSDKEYICEFIESHHLNQHVIMLGGMTHEKVISYYSICDITILPSLMEAVSISGLESLASGKLIIGTNVGGNSEIIVDGQTGYLCRPGSAKALADNIIKVFRDPSTIEEFSKNARALACQKYDWAVATERNQKIYNNLVGDK